MKTTSHPYPVYPASYRLRLQGRVSTDWSDWLSSLVVQVEGAGGTAVTVLTGKIQDQAALFGLLSFVRDLGLTLISAEYLPEEVSE